MSASSENAPTTGTVELVAPSKPTLTAQQPVPSGDGDDVEDVPEEQIPLDFERRQDHDVSAAHRQQQERAARKAAQIQRTFQEKEDARHEALLFTHEEMKQRYLDYYDIDVTKPLDPTIMTRVFTDIFDDLIVLNRIMRDDKRGRWADAVEFGVGVVFGILILIGSIFIALDASKENPIVCTTSCTGNPIKCETDCDEASNMIGTSGMLEAGSWIVVAGGMGFIIVYLWRIFVKVRLARKHHSSLLTFFNDLVKEGSTGKSKQLKNTGLVSRMLGKNKVKRGDSNTKVNPVSDDVAVNALGGSAIAATSRFYRDVPSFYAPRSAYTRSARAYSRV